RHLDGAAVLHAQDGGDNAPGGEVGVVDARLDLVEDLPELQGDALQAGEEALELVRGQAGQQAVHGQTRRLSGHRCLPRGPRPSQAWKAPLQRRTCVGPAARPLVKMGKWVKVVCQEMRQGVSGKLLTGEGRAGKEGRLLTGPGASRAGGRSAPGRSGRARPA